MTTKQAKESHLSNEHGSNVPFLIKSEASMECVTTMKSENLEFRWRKTEAKHQNPLIIKKVSKSQFC